MRPPRDIVNDDLVLRQLGSDLSAIILAGDDSSEDTNEKNIILVNAITELLEIANGPNSTASQRTAACNPLCAVLETCHESKIKNVQGCLWTNDVWLQALSFFLERSDVVKPRSMRQLLVILTTTLREDVPPDRRTEVHEYVIQKLLKIITGRTSRSQLKPALQALELFLQKGILSVRELLTSYGLFQNQTLKGISSISALLRDLLQLLFNSIPNNDAAHTAGRLVSSLLTYSLKQKDDLPDVYDDQKPPPWVIPFYQSFSAHSEELQSYKNLVFPALFSFDLEDYLTFLYDLDLGNYVDVMEGNTSVKWYTEKTLHPSAKIGLLFAALQSGKEIGLIVDVESRNCKTVRIQGKVIEIPDAFISRLLGDISQTIRLSAFSLLTSSAFIARPFTVGSLRVLQQILPNIIADTDANARSEVLGLIQRLFDRLRAATAALNRDVEKSTLKLQALESPESSKSESKRILLDAHKNFLQAIIQSRISDLRPTSPYQRHFVSLKCIIIALRSGLDKRIPCACLSKQARGQTLWPFNISIISDHLLRNLYDLMLNAFDDVRTLASMILKYHFLSSEHTHLPVMKQSVVPALAEPSGISTKLIVRANEAMLRTGRADHADGVARLYELNCVERRPSQDQDLEDGHRHSSRAFGVVSLLVGQLESTIRIAETNSSLAINGNPMHGIFASLTYIISQDGFYSELIASKPSAQTGNDWAWLHARIFDCIRRMWSSVQHVLCNDAPEGHLPPELEGEQAFSTKDVLSYSWRALKDASLLLRAIATNATLGTDEERAMLTYSQFESLGQLCFTQLTELRHRGAFSTVAQTFASFCARCAKSKVAEVSRLLSQWFEETMQAIQSRSTVLTRRSGGIPALMIGILTAEPEGTLFGRAIEELHHAASEEGFYANIEESDLPQVHALNCLKDIFTHTKLGQASEPYIGRILTMAGSKFESSIWAIRNCGLMLFRALIDRLLGNDDQGESLVSTKYSKLSYEKYPGLLDTLLRSLRPKLESSPDAGYPQAPATAVIQTEAVFPALQILQRAPPPASYVAEFRKLMFDLICSPSWHIRDMAAKTLARTFDPTELQMTYESIALGAYTSQNDLHGRLLTLKYAVMMSNQCADTEDNNLYVDLLGQNNDLYVHNSCPVTRYAYVNLLLLAAKAHGRSRNFRNDSSLEIEEAFIKVIEIDILSPIVASERESCLSSLLRRSAAEFYIRNNIVYNSSSVRTSLPKALKVIADAEEPETAIAILESIATIFEDNSLRLDGVLLEIVTAINAFTLSANPQVLATLLTTSDSLLRFLSTSNTITETTLAPLLSIATNTEPFFAAAPSFLEASLSISGILLDLRLQTHRNLRQQDLGWLLANDFVELGRRIDCSLKDTCSFYERFAAVRSLDGLQNIWTQPGNGFDKARLSLMFATYDALKDDDDEIRDVASGVAARILASPQRMQVRKQVPLIASARLAQYMARQYSTSSDLFYGALWRLLGLDSRDGAAAMKPFLETYAQVRAIDSTLFAKEKQNLFADDSRETSIWSRVLVAADAKAIPPDLAAVLTTWTMDGLGALTQAARDEYDGPLGWTSKPEVFVLALRVIYAADVLLQWREKTTKVGRKGSEIKQALAEFKTAAEGSAVHEALTIAVDKTLEKAALRKMESVKMAIRSIVGVY
ncbi:hypothetical protein EJ05DRAFT_41398 [Pseudovirgaria hyperparasitica]|uniref:Uncharacterized protein n=1 Tax=Pseudovirgaria hyperparasitica TaxID=470096 RepID=A0A6A6WMR4_9PEZI|nr:uncharacterized protein EJ05DRAFT_41398 [Pseudovirgaria hyperparasitica]KAF2763505.1 hypothetical protein EJ05DRAFT_41398 [Pseudovirgaria hyperparasitica]